MAKKKKAATKKFERPQGLSTGCTLLNCALNDDPLIGLETGYYYYWVGDSGSAKSGQMMNICAEAVSNPEFDHYNIVIDDVELGYAFSEEMFGKKTAARVMAPQYDSMGLPKCSETIEDFYDNLFENLENGPCIYILDSQDSLSSESEMKKVQKARDARKKGTVEAGSFGDGKARIHSQMIRQMLHKLASTGSILIVVNQNRDNLGFNAFAGKTRSGGRALKFYARTEIWTSCVKKLRKKVGTRELQTGIMVKASSKKNRQTGNECSIQFYWSNEIGIDDIQTSIDFGIEMGFVTKSGRTNLVWEMVDGEEFTGTRKRLIALFEESEEEREALSEIVGIGWAALRAKARQGRKSRYE